MIVALGGLSALGTDFPPTAIPTRGTGIEVHDHATLLHTRSTCATETPLPAAFLPTRLLDTPTGSLPGREAVSSLVKHAASHVRMLAVIPIDEQAEKVVDELFARVERRSERRPLR